ncbi:MAG: hypothetical protein J7L95_00850 [Prolixibacteraceae bacterium]|nr:hypothetical protein [Prolixibacteraceae bacterium]
MKISRTHLFLLLLFFSLTALSQEKTNYFSLLFYNTENLFDLKDDPKTNDDEFTPGGDRHWTYKRFNHKILNISKVILGASGWTPPAVVGLCEVENRWVLEQLVNKTPLKAVGYKIIHKESPDHRGIDVALLFNPKQFTPVKYNYYPLELTNGTILKTREILYVLGVTNKGDTLHLFFNHWPSRYSGLLETRPLRNRAAFILKQKVNDLMVKYKSPKIIIMGDFNDQPTDESISKVLQAAPVSSGSSTGQLYNLSLSREKAGLGTIKYKSQWSVFDQVIVSGAILQKSADGLWAKPVDASILQMPFLFEKDEKWGGKRLKRNYIGFSYNGGFSDHLPILLKLKE